MQRKGNQPLERKADSFLPLTIPMSNKNIAKKPLKISFVNGLMPSACLAFANKPIIKLHKISNTLPLVNECFTTPNLLTELDLSLL